MHEVRDRTGYQLYPIETKMQAASNSATVCWVRETEMRTRSLLLVGEYWHEVPLKSQNLTPDLSENPDKFCREGGLY